MNQFEIMFWILVGGVAIFAVVATYEFFAPFFHRRKHRIRGAKLK